MDVSKLLAELRQERQQLEEAIMTLERLGRGRGKRRGRPPAWMNKTSSNSGTAAPAAVGPDGEVKRRRGRPPGSKNKPKSATTA